MAKSSLLIFDGDLAYVAGHWFEYDRATATLARGHGISTTIMAHTSFDGAGYLEQDGVEVDRSIRWSFFRDHHGFYRHGAIIEHVGAFLHALSNCRDVLRHLKGRRYDCVFLPGTHLADVLAWYLLGLIGVFRKVDRLVLLLRWDVIDHMQPNPVPARKKQAWRWLFGLMRKRIASGQVALVADSTQLAEDYFLVSGQRAIPIPSPRILTADDSDRAANKSTITFGMTGPSRHEKGIDLFLGAITDILACGDAPNARFLLQFDQRVDLPDGSVLACPPEVASSPRVEIVDHPMSPDEYKAAFARIDCMVLPYRRELYVARTSAVAVESACADKPLIYTADCWLQEFAESQGAGMAVPSDDQAAVRQAIISIARNWTHYSQAAAASGKLARGRNGGDGFLAVLLGRPV